MPEFKIALRKSAREHIGPERSALLDRVITDQAPYRFFLSDWQKIEASLRSGIVDIYVGPPPGVPTTPERQLTRLRQRDQRRPTHSAGPSL